MARPRNIPDAMVHDAVLSLIRSGGDKAVTFAAVAGRVGLAASSLAGRHGSVARMIAAAHAGAWDRLEQATPAILADAPMAPKGAVRILKQLSALGHPDPAAAPDRAAEWRTVIETALALRLGGGTKGRELAAILFSCWQGQLRWADAPPLRLKDVIKRLLR